ncbi:hypothetical protein CCR85_13730 [Rhodothalassium salexigens]|uniref:hypothetical protein n=1 Tax=Rhodothalassium salexigens TaxID=1086 RepID=UPI001912AC04|nr:hypothetical protein [Rhodothalassium salexigens]MBK5912547.1 hypothetical protein [Rhodothalassium salexigens]MBK5920816.1 hypothetical protein [Rhodothalassium salexigens]
MTGTDQRTDNVIPGPGRLPTRGDVARSMDDTVQALLAGLETVVDCADAARRLTPVEDRDERLDRFCAAIAEMAQPTLAALAERFDTACREARLDPRRERAIILPRAEMVIAYFKELAILHGAAFDRDLAAPGPLQSEALSRLDLLLHTQVDHLLEGR